MYKLILIAAIVASANAGVLLSSPVVTHVTQNEVVGYSAGIQREKVDANVPASTTLIKDTNVVTPIVAPVVRSAVVQSPVVHSVVAAPVLRSAVPVQTVQSVVGSPVVYSAGVAGSPLVYSAVNGLPVHTVVNGARVVQVHSPVENHGYQVVY